MSAHDVLELIGAVYGFRWVPDEVWWAFGWAVLVLTVLGVSVVVTAGMRALFMGAKRWNPDPPIRAEAVPSPSNTLLTSKEW